MNRPPANGIDHKKRTATRTRRVVVLSLLGAIFTLVLLAVFAWPRLHVTYYLWKLRRAPDLVESWLLEQESNRLEREALGRFFKERQGQEVLFALYLAEYDRRRHDPTTIIDGLSRDLGRQNDNGFMFLAERNFSYSVMQGVLMRHHFSMMNIPANPELRGAILGHMQACVGQSFRSAKIPQCEFHVEAIVDGATKPPPWRTDGVWLRSLKRSKAGYVCYFRRLEPRDE